MISLARMMGLDTDALICDFAEVYHVLDYRALPARLVATLAAGLGPGSRIRMKIAGETITTDTMLRAVIADMTSLLFWVNTKNVQKGKDRPKSLLKALTHTEEPDEPMGFASGELFDRWWEENVKTGGADNA